MKRLGSVLFYLTFAGLIASGTSLDEALALERQGDLKAAGEAYNAWLDDNIGEEGASDVLIHSSNLAAGVEESLDTIELFLPRLPVNQSYSVYAKLASLETMLGRLGDAAVHFKRAAGTGGRQGQLWHVESLAIRFAMGDFASLMPEALSLSKTGLTQFIRDESLALAAASQAKTGDATAALVLISTRIDSATGEPVASPLLWFTLLEIADSLGRADFMRKAVRALKSDFPASALSYLSQSQVFYWESPSNLIDSPGSSFLYSSRENFSSLQALQAGVFRNRDGAASLRTSLENDGFTAWLEEDGELWRVLVNEGSGNTASELQAKGYEALIRR